jgi:hypothetical protein
MVEELCDRDTPAHVEVWPVCEQSCVFFTHRKKNIAEFLEVQFAIAIRIVSPKQKENIVMCEFMETNFFEGNDHVLD